MLISDYSSTGNIKPSKRFTSAGVGQIVWNFLSNSRLIIDLSAARLLLPSFSLAVFVTQKRRRISFLNTNDAVLTEIA
jgi:hypothetical protein